MRTKSVLSLALTLFILDPCKQVLANSEDPDEMLHNAAVHQDLDSLQRYKQIFNTEPNHNLENFTCEATIYTAL